MDAVLSRASIPERADPHDWNTWDHYRNIHERRLEEHPFVDHSNPNTLEFLDVGSEGILSLQGRVYCFRGVVLEVEKWYESHYFGTLRRVRCYSYRYAAWVEGGHPALRYHNVHRNDDEYHHRVFNPLTGVETGYETLLRYQFPVFTEVLDELELITRVLEG